MDLDEVFGQCGYNREATLDALSQIRICRNN